MYYKDGKEHLKLLDLYVTLSSFHKYYITLVLDVHACVNNFVNIAK